MKKNGKIFRVVLKATGILIIVLLVTILSIIGILNTLFKGDNDQGAHIPTNNYTTHSFEVNREDRLAKGMYIPSGKTTFAFTVSLSGEALQDCQLVVSTSTPKCKSQISHLSLRPFQLYIPFWPARPKNI